MVSQYMVCPYHGRDCKDCRFWDEYIAAHEGDAA